MPLHAGKILDTIFPLCHSIIGAKTWDKILASCGTSPKPDTFLKRLETQPPAWCLPEYLPDLARLEKTFYEVKASESELPAKVEYLQVNPTVQSLELSWKNLTSILDSKEDTPKVPPEPGQEVILLWAHPKKKNITAKPASDEDLLALKMVLEEVDSWEVAEKGAIPVGRADSVIDRAVERGLLLRPPSRIRRDPATFSADASPAESAISSPSFALQWHITQACDLKCKHCYDRSNRQSLKFEKAVEILNDLHSFCRSRYVRGHVVFTGGNPLLYPRFPELYRAASQMGFMLAILGNPAPRKEIEELISIQRPRFFQVSLEGLPQHNDMIRGKGHFERVIDFLKILKDLGLYSMVMLTLTRDNMGQVLPLADMLRGHTDSFFFNRLSMVGEGANLQLPTREEYAAFLNEYMDAAQHNPILGLKDNLFNIIRHKRSMPLFDGCTGYGCGAAFNFLTALSDGEVHACRKFPSPVGNLYRQSISEIYDSAVARQYRAGCRSCKSCVIRPLCGGCLAIAHSYGLNVFEEKDPHCFMENPI